MANNGQVARLVGRAGDAEPTAADLIDPIALEERLVEARVRRAAALSRRKSGEPYGQTSSSVTVGPERSRHPRLATDLDAIPGVADTAKTVRSGSQRFSRDALLAAVFLAGLLGGFALVFLAPAGLRQQIARLIAPGSDSIPSTGSVVAPIVGDAIATGLSITTAPTLAIFPARPVVAFAGVKAPPRSVEPAPDADAAPRELAASEPGKVTVTFPGPGLSQVEAEAVGPRNWRIEPPTLQARVPAAFAVVTKDTGPGGDSHMSLPAPPRIGDAPESLDAGTAQRPPSVRIYPKLYRVPTPMPLHGLPPDAGPANPETGLTPPVPFPAPRDLRLGVSFAPREPDRLNADPSRPRPPRGLPAASRSDALPDPTVETAALAEATRSAARVLEENRPVTVSAMRRQPAFKDAGHFSPAPGTPGPGSFGEDGKASVFVGVGRQSGIVMATYWPPGELIAAATARKARRPAAVRQAPATNSQSAADQAAAKQVTRIILQRRIERMLRDLR